MSGKPTYVYILDNITCPYFSMHISRCVLLGHPAMLVLRRYVFHHMVFELID